MGKKLTEKDLIAKMNYHEKRFEFHQKKYLSYEDRLLELEENKSRIGFKHYD